LVKIILFEGENILFVPSLVTHVKKLIISSTEVLFV